MISAKAQFERLYWYVRDMAKFRVRVMVTKGLVRGRAHLHRRRPCLIEIWVPEPTTPRDYKNATAALIHEYGHCILRYVPHTEREAWAFGRRAVSTQSIPGTWKTYKRACLKTYGKEQTLRINSGFGRGWKWKPK